MSPRNRRKSKASKIKEKNKHIKTESEKSRTDYVIEGALEPVVKIEVKTEPDLDIIEIPEFPDLKIKVIRRGKHPYTCRKCDIGFWTKKAFDAHNPIHVLKKGKQPTKRFRCDVCGKEFNKLCDVERHNRVHTGEKPCVCSICHKGFQQTHNLSKHLLTHTQVKPFHCDICNKQFGRNDVLNRHLLTHTVDKPLKCDFCQKGFIRQSQLSNHLEKNHQDAKCIETAVAHDN